MPGKVALHSVIATVMAALFMAFVFVTEGMAAEAMATEPTVAGPGAGRPHIVEIERLTSRQVRERLVAGVDTIIVPTGGTEQNGPHMALGKHNFIVAETARRIARDLGDTLVAPVLAYVPEGDPGKRAGHMAYPGTISLPEPLFEQVLEAAATSFRTHGFRRIVFLGDSGGNQRPQARVAERLTDAWRGDGIVVVNAADYYAKNGGDALLTSEGLTAAQIGTHAGVRDTSELLFVAPATVDLSLASSNADGASGDARLARAEWGERLIAGKVAAAVAEIRRHPARAPAANGRETGLLGWLPSW